jgi:hypothetical protein
MDTISSKKLKHGDVVRFIEDNCGTHNDSNRLWVILEVTQEDFDTSDINCKKPGLYAFGGKWYRGRKDDHKSYGKIIDPYWRKHREKAIVIGNIKDVTIKDLNSYLDGGA